MSVAILIGLVGFSECKDFFDFLDFFNGFGNLLNAILTLGIAVALFCFFLYSYFLIMLFYHQREDPITAEKLERLTDGSNMKTYSSSLINIYFMLRRLFTAIILVLLCNRPAFQITLLMYLSLYNFIYIVSAKPYDSRSTNINEAFNEFCILACAYMMNTFSVCTDTNFSILLSWIFIGITCLNMFINISVMVVKIIIIIY